MRAFLLLILLALACSARADSPEGDAPPEERPTARAFDAERINALRAEYDYDADLRRAPSLWDRFKEWLYQWLQGLLGTKAGGFVIDNLLYLIAIAMIVVAIAVLSRNGLHRMFHGAPRSLGQVIGDEDDIREMDLPAMIARAEADGDLRLAVRLHYLLVLRKLVDQGVLNWSPERTDRDYMRQIADPSLRSRFAHVALVFQWVWYGHAEVDRERYVSIQRPFIEFETVPAR
jgi:hypothetical protein